MSQIQKLIPTWWINVWVPYRFFLEPAITKHDDSLILQHENLYGAKEYHLLKEKRLEVYLRLTLASKAQSRLFEHSGFYRQKSPLFWIYFGEWVTIIRNHKRILVAQHRDQDRKSARPCQIFKVSSYDQRELGGLGSKVFVHKTRSIGWLSIMVLCFGWQL